MFREQYRVEAAGLAVGRVERDQDFTADLSFYHNEYQIHCILSGERYFFLEGVCYRMEKGTMALIDKSLIPKTCIIGGSFHDRILVEIEGERFGALCSCLGLDLSAFFREHHGVFQAGEGSLPAGVFSRLDALCREEVPEREARLKLEILNLMAHASAWEGERCPSINVRFAEASAQKQRKIHEVADYIAGHYAEDCSVDRLAGMFFMSKSYLCRIFREVTNFTISEYVNLYRIAASRTYLLDESISIAQVAERLGYDSLTYFERVFKKQMSITPLQFRKKNRKE